jgi:glutamine amidotransferase
MNNPAAKTICIVDYGMGNTQSVGNAIESLGGNYVISNRKDEIARCDGIILPGVGAFKAAMENLHALDLVAPLTDRVMEKKKPFLGICLGMQLLAEDSVELGFSAGLGWLKGHVVALQPSQTLRVPHVGWNNTQIVKPQPLFHGIDAQAHFYFDHSYTLQCEPELVAATFEYGGSFVAAVQRDNLFATQFHPEKSQRHGLKLLRNFLNFVAATGRESSC